MQLATLYVLCMLSFLITFIIHNLHSYFHFNLVNQKYHSLSAFSVLRNLSPFLCYFCIFLFVAGCFPLWHTNTV